MRVTFDLSSKETSAFEGKCQAIIKNVFRGTKKVTTEAAKEIIQNSKEQVPKATNTLLMSAFYEVRRRSGLSSYAYEAIIGYGGNGDPVSPTTGRNASSYMLAVHENLSAQHTNGKAKFLEDPVKDYAEKKFKRVAMEYISDELANSV